MALGVRTLLMASSAGLALSGAPVALADSGTGVDTALGNVMNPNGQDTTLQRDPDGMGVNETSRSPTGLLRPQPRLDRTPSVRDGLWHGSVEGGGLRLRGPKDNARFKEYKSLDNGLTLLRFGAEYESATTPLYADVVAGGLGRDDKFVGLTVGRYNDWRLRLSYDETPHVFTTNYRSLWSGVGSERLTLGYGLTPGGSPTAAATQTNLRNALSAITTSELGIVRKKAAVRYDATLSEQWKAFAGYTHESRQGSRPFGAVFGGGGGGGNVEIPESLDYTTHDLLAGLQWNGARASVNVTASASAFKNHIGTLTFDNPLTVTTNTIAGPGATPALFTRGVYDLYPDNTHYNVKAEAAYSMPEWLNSRFTGVVSLGRLRQNDSLIPPTDYALTGVTINGLSAENRWNTLDALTKSSAGASIDTRLVDLGWAISPTPLFDLKLKARHYETRNNTEYWACNPLTGQWGRLLNNGSGGAVAGIYNVANSNLGSALPLAQRCNAAAVLAYNVANNISPSAGNINIRNVPFAHRQLQYGVTGDWRFRSKQSANVALERETVDRDHREREETWEDRLKLGYTNRAFEFGTVRISAEHARRRGSVYRADPYDEFYSSGLGVAPTAAGNVASFIHSIDQFRKFDLADRDQNILNLRVNAALRADLDASMSLQLKDARFPASDYGRRGNQRTHSLNADLNWQPADDVSLYTFLAHQNGRIAQRGLQANACAIGTTYYFWSNGLVTATPALPAPGLTLVTTQAITGANFLGVCGSAGPTSPLYPTSREWSVQQRDRSNTLGVGSSTLFKGVKLDGNLAYTNSRVGTRYQYNAAALAITDPIQLALIGDGFGDLKYELTTLTLSAWMPLSRQVGLRLLYRGESGRIVDWHYDGVSANPVPANNAVYLDGGPQRYRVHAVGVMLTVDF